LTEHFDVVVTSALYPQGFDRTRTLFIDGHAVRKVDHFVFGAVDDQNGGCDFRNFVNTGNERLTFEILNNSDMEPRDLESQPNFNSSKFNFHIPTITHLGNASKNHVRLVAGNATRIPDMSGEWSITAPTS
jgi:hypothetical protein